STRTSVDSAAGLFGSGLSGDGGGASGGFGLDADPLPGVAGVVTAGLPPLVEPVAPVAPVAAVVPPVDVEGSARLSSPAPDAAIAIAPPAAARVGQRVSHSGDPALRVGEVKVPVFFRASARRTASSASGGVITASATRSSAVPRDQRLIRSAESAGLCGARA